MSFPTDHQDLFEKFILLEAEWYEDYLQCTKAADRELYAEAVQYAERHNLSVPEYVLEYFKERAE